MQTLVFDPKPGSPKAVAAGCICPRADNAHGAGVGSPPRFFISGECPIHAVRKPDDWATRTAAAYVSDLRPSTGEARIHFEETHAGEDGGELRVPGGFALGIPVFRGGDLYQVPVRLRYRVSKGAILWSIALHRTDRVFDHAFEQACRLVEEATGLPIYQGRPERS